MSTPSITPTFATAQDVTWIPVDLPAVAPVQPVTNTVQRRSPAALTVAPPAAVPAIGLALLEGGMLATDGGAVADTSGSLVRQSFSDDSHFQREFGRPRTLPNPEMRPGRLVSLVSQWSRVYYHWIFETLPRLAVLEASGIEIDGIILPEHAGSFQRQSLALAGWGDVPVHTLTERGVRADQLVWLSPISPPGFPNRPTIDWLRRALGAPDVDPWRRIYLPRRHTRRVFNEGRIQRIAVRHGFEVVHPDKLDMEAQVRLFAETRVAAGPHGAAFSNASFSQHLTAIEFYQPGHVNWSITSALAAAGHEHWSLVGRRVPTGRSKTNHSVYVNPGQVELTFRKVEETV